MAGMMTGVFNQYLRAAGYSGRGARPLDSRFVMTDRERSASREDMSLLMRESAAVRNSAAERAGRIATDCG